MQISIIVPTYNSSAFIEESIRSIINNTSCYDKEIVVVDDGSTDNTIKILKPYIKNQHIRYYYKDNGGAASARNYGIHKSKGKYIGFLDADDTYLPGMINQCVEYLESGGYDIVSVDNYMVYYEGDTEIRREIQTYEWIEKSTDELFCLFLKFGAIGGVHKAFFRRDLFDKVGFLDTSLPIYEDLDLWIRIALHGLKWGHIRQPLVAYNHRGTGSSLFTTSQKRNMDCRLRVMRRYKQEALWRFPEMKKVYGENLWDFGRNYLLQYKGLREGLSCLLESMMIDPSWQRLFSSIKSQLHSRGK
jgi:glycosyltransferase involved in cell wall biosynthesis